MHFIVKNSSITFYQYGAPQDNFISNYSTQLQNHWVLVKYRTPKESMETESHPILPHILEECHVIGIFLFSVSLCYLTSKISAACPRSSCTQITLIHIQAEDLKIVYINQWTWALGTPSITNPTSLHNSPHC